MYQTSFVKRNKGQRYEQRLLPLMLIEDNGKAIEPFGAGANDLEIGTIKVCEDFPGFTPYGTPTTFQAIEVTLKDGTIVPAYRTKSPDNNYCICQHMQYKAVRTQN